MVEAKGSEGKVAAKERDAARARVHAAVVALDDAMSELDDSNRAALVAGVGQRRFRKYSELVRILRSVRSCLDNEGKRRPEHPAVVTHRRVPAGYVDLKPYFVDSIEVKW